MGCENAYRYYLISLRSNSAAAHGGNTSVAVSARSLAESYVARGVDRLHWRWPAGSGAAAAIGAAGCIGAIGCTGREAKGEGTACCGAADAAARRPPGTGRITVRSESSGSENGSSLMRKS